MNSSEAGRANAKSQHQNVPRVRASEGGFLDAKDVRFAEDGSAAGGRRWQERERAIVRSEGDRSIVEDGGVDARKGDEAGALPLLRRGDGGVVGAAGGGRMRGALAAGRGGMPVAAIGVRRAGGVALA